MKKTAILIVAVAICVFAGMVHAGYFANKQAAFDGTTKTVTFDLNKATAQANLVLECYSSRGRVYGRMDGVGQRYLLASYSSAGKTAFKYNVTTPYRYVMVVYTSMMVSATTATKAHTTSVGVFSW